MAPLVCAHCGRESIPLLCFDCLQVVSAEQYRAYYEQDELEITELVARENAELCVTKPSA